jgi:tetratricopeptide (TPR) repeat protein
MATGLASGPAGPPGFRRTLATCLLDQAGVQYSLGKFTEVEDLSQKAAVLFRDLLDAPREQSHPYDPQLLAMALNRRAMAQRELRQFEAALTSHGEAVTRARALPGREGNNDFQNFLGRALLEQGLTLERLPDRKADAEESFREAIAIWDSLRKQYGQVASYFDGQAVAYQARGRIRVAQGLHKQAEDDFQMSVSLLEKVVAALTYIPDYRSHLGETYGALGRLALARGDPERAAYWLQKAKEALGEALRRAPGDAIIRRALDEVEADFSRVRAAVPPNHP